MIDLPCCPFCYEPLAPTLTYDKDDNIMLSFTCDCVGFVEAEVLYIENLMTNKEDTDE